MAGKRPALGLLILTLALCLFIAACEDDPDGGDAYVFRLDPATGNVTWEHRTAGYTIDAPAAHGGLVVVTGRSTVFAMDAVTGERRWSHEGIDGTRSPLPASEGVILAPTFPDDDRLNIGPLLGLDAATGEERWAAGCIFGGYGPQVLGAGDGLAFLASTCDGPETRIVAFDIASGNETWSTPNLQYRPPGQDGYAVGIGGAPVAEGSRVLYPNRDGTVNALDAATGELQWSTRITGDPDSPLLSPGDGVVFAWLPRESVLVALDIETGGERWRFEQSAGDYGALNFTLFNNPLVVDGTVYTFATPSEMVALDLETGAEQWRTDAPAGTMAANGDVLYLGGHARIRALDRHTGSSLWEHNYNLAEQTRMQLNFVDGMLLATAWGESPPYRD